MKEPSINRNELKRIMSLYRMLLEIDSSKINPMVVMGAFNVFIMDHCDNRKAFDDLWKELDPIFNDEKKLLNFLFRDQEKEEWLEKTLNQIESKDKELG